MMVVHGKFFYSKSVKIYLLENALYGMSIKQVELKYITPIEVQLRDALLF